MIPLVTGMLSSLVMGGVRSLLGGGQIGGGGAPIPTSITGMPIGQAPVLPGLANYPRYADGDLVRDLPIPITPSASDAPPLEEMTGVSRESLANYLDLAGQGSAQKYKDDFAKGDMAYASGRAGVKIPMFDGQLRGGVSGGINYIDLEGPFGQFEQTMPQLYGADIGYSKDGRDISFSYGQSPDMQGGMDRSYMVNYSMPFANGGIADLPPIPPGETPQMAYAMDKGGMIRGPGGGVDDLISGTIDNRTKVLLSDGEYVIPARVVSALGDGSSEAGAKVLDGMVARVKGEATKRIQDNGEINHNKVMPA